MRIDGYVSYMRSPISIIDRYWSNEEIIKYIIIPNDRI